MSGASDVSDCVESGNTDPRGEELSGAQREGRESLGRSGGPQGQVEETLGGWTPASCG